MRSHGLFKPLAFTVAFTIGSIYAQNYGNPSSQHGAERLQQERQTKSLKGSTAGAQKVSADQIIQNWKAKPKEVAQTLISKYGQPDEVTPQRLIWHNNGPWKRTEVVNEEIPHSFPMPHTDIVEQTIALKVPPEKFDELAKYDGSVIVERTKGEISARCDKEEMNFLALNLAKDIVDGKKSVKQARDFYAKTAKAFKEGQKDAYTQGLQFEPLRLAAGDPDQPAGATREPAGSPGGSETGQDSGKKQPQP
ncbi:MAG: hypothetical protein AB1813_04860 [Verrucomicrobiota bacterium]